MPATSNTAKKHYAISRFGLDIDGHDLTDYVKNVEGGMLKSESVKEPTGSFNLPSQHLGPKTVEPITMELGLTKTNWLLSMVEKVVNNREHTRLSGHIYHADANSKSRFEQEFSRALITEVALPAFTGDGKDLAMLKVKMQPEIATFKTGGSTDIPMGTGAMQKSWQNNMFRLSLEVNGTKLDCTHVTKIDAMTVTIGTKAIQRGHFHLPEYMPTIVKMPKLVVHIPLAHASTFVDWARSSHGTEGSKADGASGYEATGSLELISPNAQKVLYTISFEGVGPEQISIVKSEGGSATAKTLKVDMYVTKLRMGS